MSDNPPTNDDKHQLPLPDKKLSGKVQTGRLSPNSVNRLSPDAKKSSASQISTDDLTGKNVDSRDKKVDFDGKRPTTMDDKPVTAMDAEPDDVIELDEDSDLIKRTAVLSRNNPMMRRALNQQLSTTMPNGTSSLGEKREVILLIRGMAERLVITEEAAFKLGRFDIGPKGENDVDLVPYGAIDRGVSRLHAQIHLEGENLYITDLGSTNGTYLSGQKLEPHTPALLRKGDELLIGRLQVQVLFR